MGENTVYFIIIGSINTFLVFIFTYLALKNAIRIKGAITQYLMVVGAFLFLCAGVSCVMGYLLCDICFLLGFFLFIIGFVLIFVSKIYLDIKVRRIVGKKPRSKLARTFTYNSYRLAGILTILIFAVPSWIFEYFYGPTSVFGLSTLIISIIGFGFLIMGEKRLFITTKIIKDQTKEIDVSELGLLRNDIIATKIYVDIVNTFLSRPLLGAAIINKSLDQWSEDHPILFENTFNKAEGKIEENRILRNLDRLYEKERLSLVLSEFSIFLDYLIDLYSRFTSSKYAKDRLAESYKMVKTRYGKLSIIYDILRNMPKDILEDEKLVLLSRNELEDKVRERTLKLETEIEERKKIESKLKKSQKKIELQNIRLRRLDKVKSNFLNITSHELRTPMSAIKGYVQMMLKGILGNINEEQKKSLKVVLNNTDRLDNLIQDILDVSRLMSGTIKFVVNENDIRLLVAEMAETMQLSADLKNISINTVIDTRIPKMVFDRDRISQVFINIIDNAIKFSPEGAVINLKAEKKEDHVLFEVQDFGRGIPKNKQKKIFETFYQVDSGIDRKFEGAGLGLAISRGIILAHGGRIWVDSAADKGITFYFTLPIKPVQDSENIFKEIDMFGVDSEIRAVPL